MLSRLPYRPVEASKATSRLQHSTYTPNQPSKLRNQLYLQQDEPITPNPAPSFLFAELSSPASLNKAMHITECHGLRAHDALAQLDISQPTIQLSIQRDPNTRRSRATLCGYLRGTHHPNVDQAIVRVLTGLNKLCFGDAYPRDREWALMQQCTDFQLGRRHDLHAYGLEVYGVIGSLEVVPSVFRVRVATNEESYVTAELSGFALAKQFWKVAHRAVKADFVRFRGETGDEAQMVRLSAERHARMTSEEVEAELVAGIEMAFEEDRRQASAGQTVPLSGRETDVNAKLGSDISPHGAAKKRAAEDGVAVRVKKRRRGQY